MFDESRWPDRREKNAQTTHGGVGKGVPSEGGEFAVLNRGAQLDWTRPKGVERAGLGQKKKAL